MLPSKPNKKTYKKEYQSQSQSESDPYSKYFTPDPELEKVNLLYTNDDNESKNT